MATACIVFTCIHPAQAQAKGIEAHRQELVFIQGQPVAKPSLNLEAPNGTELLLQLSPEYDINHQLTVLELSAEVVGDESKKNLLEPSGRWHGMQPFVFAAPCFGRHGDSCGYVNPRMFKLTSLNLEVHVSVADVNVSPAMSPGDYTFKKLQLEIESAPLRSNIR